MLDCSNSPIMCNVQKCKLHLKLAVCTPNLSLECKLCTQFLNVYVPPSASFYNRMFHLLAWWKPFFGLIVISVALYNNFWKELGCDDSDCTPSKLFYSAVNRQVISTCTALVMCFLVCLFICLFLAHMWRGRKEEEGLGGKCGRGRLLQVLSRHLP